MKLQLACGGQSNVTWLTREQYRQIAPLPHLPLIQDQLEREEILTQTTTDSTRAVQHAKWEALIIGIVKLMRQPRNRLVTISVEMDG